MKKIILTLSVCLSCIMVANAEYPHVVDTLPKRIVNGLEIIPVKKLMNGEAFFGILGSLILKSAFSALKINAEEK